MVRSEDKNIKLGRKSRKHETLYYFVKKYLLHFFFRVQNNELQIEEGKKIFFELRNDVAADGSIGSQEEAIGPVSNVTQFSIFENDKSKEVEGISNNQFYMQLLFIRVASYLRSVEVVFVENFCEQQSSVAVEEKW